MLSRLTKYLRLLLDTVFPPKCVFCTGILKQGTGLWICESCQKKIARIDGLCPKCIRLFDIEDGLPICHNCRSANRYYDAVITVYSYEGAVRRAILRYKFNNHPEYAHALSFYTAKAITDIGIDSSLIDFIVYIPADEGRKKHRGYNHVQLLAGHITKATGIPIREGVLIRRKSIPEQSRLTRKRRLINVKGAFGVDKDKDIKGTRIILIDDVFTTGATTMEASRVLKRAGAEYVLVVTVAASLFKPSLSGRKWSYK